MDAENIAPQPPAETQADTRMDQLRKFVEWERATHPVKTHIAEWALYELQRLRVAPPPSAPVGVDAHKATLASLVAAVSLLRRGGRKAAPSDAMFNMMLADYEKSIEASRDALAQQPAAVDEAMVPQGKKHDGPCWRNSHADCGC